MELFTSLKAQAEFEKAADEVQIFLESSFGGGPLYAFYDPSKRSIGLVISVPESVYGEVRNDTQSRAIQITRLRREDEAFLRLALLDLSLLKVFAVFCDEYLDGVTQEGEDKATWVFTMLNKWRRLFKLGPADRDGLTTEDEIGLICELKVLEGLICDHGTLALDYWVGPNFSPHDFELPDCSIECKATRSSDKLLVRIHGAQQLMNINEKPLFLAVQHLRQDESGEVSVPILFERICTALRGNVDQFIESIQRNDFPVPDKVSHAYKNYVSIDTHEFKVADEFPRITGIQESDRVQNVSYDVDLSDPESVPGYLEEHKFL